MTKYIYKDVNTIVKAVYLQQEFLYTATYTLSKDGEVIRMVKVFKDGTVDKQEF